VIETALPVFSALFYFFNGFIVLDTVVDAYK